jgi:hypothetical protein
MEDPNTQLASEPAAPPPETPMDDKARQVLPLVWVALATGAVALALSWFFLTAAPPNRADRLLTTPGEPTVASPVSPG